MYTHVYALLIINQLIVCCMFCYFIIYLSYVCCMLYYLFIIYMLCALLFICHVSGACFANYLLRGHQAGYGGSEGTVAGSNPQAGSDLANHC